MHQTFADHCGQRDDFLRNWMSVNDGGQIFGHRYLKWFCRARHVFGFIDNVSCNEPGQKIALTDTGWHREEKAKCCATYWKLPVAVLMKCSIGEAQPVSAALSCSWPWTCSRYTHTHTPHALVNIVISCQLKHKVDTGCPIWVACVDLFVQ